MLFQVLLTSIFLVSKVSTSPILSENLFPRVGTVASSANASLAGHDIAPPSPSYPGALLNDTRLLNHTAMATRPLWYLPATISRCNDSSDVIDHQLISDLISDDIALSTVTSMVDAGAVLTWGRTFKTGTQGTQYYICNFNQYAVAHNVAEFNVVDGMLNNKCGDAGGWIYFYEWNVWFGRDTTNDDGSFRPAC